MIITVKILSSSATTKFNYPLHVGSTLSKKYSFLYSTIFVKKLTENIMLVKQLFRTVTLKMASIFMSDFSPFCRGTSNFFSLSSTRKPPSSQITSNNFLITEAETCEQKYYIHVCFVQCFAAKSIKNLQACCNLTKQKIKKVS